MRDNKGQLELLGFLKDNYHNGDVNIAPILKKISELHNFDYNDIKTYCLNPLRDKGYMKDCNYSDLGGLNKSIRATYDNTRILTCLTEKGYNYLFNLDNHELSKQLSLSTLETNKAIKTASIIQWVAAVSTVLIISANCIIDFLNYDFNKATHHTSYMQQQKDSTDKEAQKRLLDTLHIYRHQIDSLVLLGKTKKQVFSKPK
jgi:hypothetical protein